jgi:hypothetical protein
MMNSQRLAAQKLVGGGKQKATAGTKAAAAHVTQHITHSTMLPLLQPAAGPCTAGSSLTGPSYLLLVLQRNILEDPARGYLQNDTIIIKYTIELVVSTGGALSRNVNINKGDLIKAPLPTLGRDLGELFRTGQHVGGASGGGGTGCWLIASALYISALAWFSRLSTV